MTTNNPSIELFCHGCGARGSVGRIAANLRCRCGSHDLDLWQGTPEQNARIAQLTARTSMWGAETANIMSMGERHDKGEPLPLNFSEWMTGKTAAPTKAAPVGGDVPGWNEYTGPRPGVSGEQNGIGTPYVCPVCHGEGFDLQDGGTCRMCGGAKVITPNADEHEEVPAVARHDYPSTQTKVPFMGKRKSKAKVDKTAALNDLVRNIEKSNPGLSRVAALELAQRTLSYAGSR